MKIMRKSRKVFNSNSSSHEKSGSGGFLHPKPLLILRLKLTVFTDILPNAHLALAYAGKLHGTVRIDLHTVPHVPGSVNISLLHAEKLQHTLAEIQTSHYHKQPAWPPPRQVPARFPA
jgi:hypothetical protein